MKKHCREFRSRLESLLEGGPQLPELSRLGWHEHLLHCGSCRGLMEREEALEVLLSSLPEPKLPPDMTWRLLRVLREGVDASSIAARATGPVALDALLDLDQSPVIPEGLAQRVMAGLEGQLRAPGSEELLDRLLERNEVQIPAGLSARVLQGVRSERALDALLDRDEVQIPVGLAARVQRAIRVSQRVSQRAQKTVATKQAPGVLLRMSSSHYLRRAAALLIFIGASVLVWQFTQEGDGTPTGAELVKEDTDTRTHALSGSGDEYVAQVDTTDPTQVPPPAAPPATLPSEDCLENLSVLLNMDMLAELEADQLDEGYEGAGNLLLKKDWDSSNEWQLEYDQEFLASLTR